MITPTDTTPDTPTADETVNPQARAIMDAAWPHYGGNHQDPEFWEIFSEAVSFTLNQIAAMREGKGRTDG